MTSHKWHNFISQVEIQMMTKIKKTPDPKISARLRVLMSQSKTLNTQQALSKASGIGQRTIGRILNGEVDSSLSTYEAICEAFRVPSNTLTSPDLAGDPFHQGSGVPVIDDPNLVAVVTEEELLLWTKGGKRLEYIAYRPDREYVKIDMITHKTTHQIKVSDDSMLQDLPLGSFAIVNTTLTPQRGNIVEAKLKSETIIFRRYKPLSNGSYELIAKNDLFDIIAESEVEQIIGVVAYSLNPLI